MSKENSSRVPGILPLFHHSTFPLLLFITFMFLFNSFLSAGKTLKIELKQVVELGRGDLMFENIESVCEDKDKNFYVLDRKAYKVYKFSPTGKLILSFGNRGQGPGDFAFPHHISVTPDEKIAVCEVRDFVSLFNRDGAFLDRVKVPKGLELTYLNPNLFYCWIWKPKVKEQILVDSKGGFIRALFALSRDLFSVSAPDETGNYVMTSYSADEYTPSLLFSHYKNYSIFAIGNQYKILLIDEKGKTVKEISRDVKPGRISAKEKKLFTERINQKRSFYKVIKNKFIKKIPDHKNYFDKIFISGKYIWVFRIKEDITDEKSPFPVDMFNHQGNFLGSVRLLFKPETISDRHAYVIEEEDEELLLIKYDLNLVPPLHD